MGLSFPGVLPLEHHAMAACGCEEGDGGLLRCVVQVAKVAYLADVGDGGHRGGSKGRHAGGTRSSPRTTFLRPRQCCLRG
jgi:hypothetical protein